MDSRMNMTQQIRGSNQGGRGKKKEEDSDAFIRLPDQEIAGCISDIGVPFVAADLLKPNPPQIQQVFEWVAELLMNTTPETVEPAMTAAAADVWGEYMDIIPRDTRNLMGFYINLRRLLIEVGINDFSFQDLKQPTHDRLVRIFSHIINFIRFRESQTGVIDEHFSKAENTKARIETLYAQNQELEAQLHDLKHRNKLMQSESKEKTARNEKLFSLLREKIALQGQTTKRVEFAKKERDDHLALLKENLEAIEASKHEAAKLRPYETLSPKDLRTTLADLSNSLSADKSQIDMLDRRSRALQMSHDTFGVVGDDVLACTKLLADVAAELKREEEENLKVTRHRDALTDRNNTVLDFEQQELLLKQKLANWSERTEKQRALAAERSQAAKERTNELQTTHVKLKAEMGEKMKLMEWKKARIEQTDKKMAELKDKIEKEIHEAHDEYLNLDSHIISYIAEMEQLISV
ncbi:MAG: kinetochore-associated Ndc80 complex subunit nuf2 [Trizodia sp. TS-e1964]|nr:MAG: kinetochore-associated Ndc80 complex subunit nuf2 [Trizodia sp. TS-e1964]